MKIQRRDAIAGTTKVESGESLVELSFVSDESCRRFSWEDWEIIDEVLVCEKSAIVGERIEAGLVQVLWNHDPDELRGVVESVRWDAGKGTAIARFSQNDKAQELLRDIQDGIIKGASVGYRVHQYQIVKEAVWEGTGWDVKLVSPKQVRAIKWEIYEISIVSIPADSTVGVGRGIAEGLTSLEQSKYRQFDYDCALELSAQWLSESKDFVMWGRAREGDRSFEVVDWINQREAWAKRYYQESSLPAVTAQIQRGVVGTLGIVGMKRLINQQQQRQNMSDKPEEANNKLEGEIDSLKAKVAELTRQNQELEARNNATLRYAQLKERADKLVSEARLEAHEFDSLFEKSLAEVLTNEPENHMRSLEFYLNQVEKRAPKLNLERSRVPDEIPDQKVVNLSEKTKAAQKYEGRWKS